MRAAPLIYLIAGEPSGDLLGGRLMAALKERTGGAVRFAGIGGDAMAAQGLESRVPLSDLAVIGVAEVLPRAPLILRRVRETVADVIRREPDAVVTIDSSGFTWRVAHGLRRRGSRLPLIHYVAPMVWAWRGGRARRMARWYDHLMTLLPFEPPYFQAVGLDATYVGHPVVESGADRGDGKAFRRRHGFSSQQNLLLLLPGSRRGEVNRLLPIFLAAAARLREDVPGLGIVVPTLPSVEAQVRAGVAASRLAALVLVDRTETYDAFAAGTVAIAASGTVALETALARLPTVVAYRLNGLTHWLVRRIVKVDYVHLVNLVLGREAVPELIQRQCEPVRLAAAARRLLDDGAARAMQVTAAAAALERLGHGGVLPGLKAADVVLSFVKGAGNGSSKR